MDFKKIAINPKLFYIFVHSTDKRLDLGSEGEIGADFGKEPQV